MLSILSFNFAAAAADEAYSEFSVTMSVEDNVINTVTDRMFGFNQEWPGSNLRQTMWLDKNYSKADSFFNDFEDKAYITPAAEYSTAYFNPNSPSTFRYISNGEKFGGNASESTYAVKNNAPLYENQYAADGTLQKPKQNLNSQNNNQQFSYALADNFVTGGLQGYTGFGQYYELGMDKDNYDVQNLTVTDCGSGNHALRLAPARGVSNGGKASYFGKNSLAIADRKTVFSARVMIDSATADVRLALIKDWNTERIKDVADRKYTNTTTLQFVKEYNTYQQMGWYEAARFADGKLTVNGEDAAEYTTGKWYTLTYTLEFAHDSASAVLTFADADGKELCKKAVDISPNDNNNASDLEYVSRYMDGFEINDRSDYGYLFSAHTDVNAAENTVAYIDDIRFVTLGSADGTGAVLNSALSEFRDNHVFPYARMAGGSANTFKWKEGIGNPSERRRIVRNDGTGTVMPYRELYAIPEWLRMIDYLNPNAQASYVINIHDSDEDIVDLIEFLTADGDINGDGVDWAAVRRENGIDHPARIYMWEVGNEPNLDYVDVDSGDEKWTCDAYVKRAGEIVTLLKKYCPDIKIAIPVNTDYEATAKAGTSWDKTILEQSWAGDIDYLAVHSYNGETVSNVNRIITYLKQNITESGHTGIKVAYTEHGTSIPSNRENYWRGIGLSSALCEAQFFNRVFTEPIVDVANLHSFTLYPGPWGVGYENDDGTFSAGTSYHLMDMYARNAVGNVMESHIDNFETVPTSVVGWDGYDHTKQFWKDGKYGYSCSAVETADGELNLFIANPRNHKLRLTLDLDEKYADYSVREVQTISGKRSGDTANSYDGYADIPDGSGGYTRQYADDMVYTTDTDADRGSLTITPYSVTMIKLCGAKTDFTAAQYMDSQSLRICGNALSANSDISLLISDKTSGEIRYVGQVKSGSDGCYTFDFKFSHNIEDCKVLIKYDGAVHDISDSVKIVDKEKDLFDITAAKGAGGVTVTVNNKYNLFGIDFTAVLAAYSDRYKSSLSGASMEENITLNPGKTVFGMDNPGGERQTLFMWRNLINMIPVFSDTDVE